MCGITGIIDYSSPHINESVLKKMNDSITSRGPDDEGFYTHQSVGLGHRRLSIIDVVSGHQPMTTKDGRYTIVFNGEIYNFKELKIDLEKEGISFETHSDTEVLLYLYSLKKEKCLDDLNGMFAFAIWDNKDKTLFAARDRMGKKPFYYYHDGQNFIFASEIKAILKHPLIKKEINPKAVQAFFTYEYVPAPLSIIKNVSKLKQAHYLKLGSKELEIKRYWTQPLGKTLDIPEREASKNLKDLLLKATEYRLISDVPLGVFLSGGVDSSSVVALMSELREGKDIKTFSINFEEVSFDESLYSETIAKKFGTDHHTQTLTAKKMVEILPDVAKYMDEPFADGSILPTYLLSKFTRKNVTVALGGDGADELFAGYPTFFASRVANLYQRFPSFFRSLVKKVSNLLPVSHNNMSFDFKVRQFLLGAEYPGVLKNQVWLSGVAPHLQNQLFQNDFLPKLSDNPFECIEEEMKNCPSNNPNEELLYFYQKFYMCDDILVKVDRASMANSLEVRAPFLDKNVVEFVSRLPYHYKLKGVTSKYLLKKTFNRKLPAMITQRSKKGFGIPISQWFKEDLKSKLLETLAKERIEKDGIFSWEYVNQIIQEHLGDKMNHRKPLFCLFMFHLWMDEYL